MIKRMCGHSYCASCYKKVIIAQVGSTFVPTHCAAMNCNDPFTMEEINEACTQAELKNCYDQAMRTMPEKISNI